MTNTSEEDRDGAADGKHDGRVHHGALDLGLEGFGVLKVGGQAFQDGVQDAAQFAGADHGGV